MKTDFFNWDSLHARLNNHYEARGYKKKKYKKIKTRQGKLLGKNLKIKGVYELWTYSFLDHRLEERIL